MALTISNYTGDGVTAPKLDTFVQLPDSGTNVLISGSVTPIGGPQVPITGSPLTMPTAPASGLTYWNIQADTGTGTATVQQSTTADPTLISATSVLVMSQTLTPTSTDPATSGDATPDTW